MLVDLVMFFSMRINNDTEKKNKNNRVVVFSHTSFPIFLYKGTNNENFQQSGKQDSFRHKMKSSASRKFRFTAA